VEQGVGHEDTGHAQIDASEHVGRVVPAIRDQGHCLEDDHGRPNDDGRPPTFAPGHEADGGDHGGHGGGGTRWPTQRRLEATTDEDLEQFGHPHRQRRTDDAGQGPALVTAPHGYGRHQRHSGGDGGESEIAHGPQKGILQHVGEDGKPPTVDGVLARSDGEDGPAQKDRTEQDAGHHQRSPGGSGDGRGHLGLGAGGRWARRFQGGRHVGGHGENGWCPVASTTLHGTARHLATRGREAVEFAPAARRLAG
jgi:hypothetical protein